MQHKLQLSIQIRQLASQQYLIRGIFLMQGQQQSIHGKQQQSAPHSAHSVIVGLLGLCSTQHLTGPHDRREFEFEICVSVL